MSYSPLYTITNKILTYVSLSEAAKEIIENSPVVPYWERKFQNQAIARTVHHSTAIEGNELDLNEAEKLIQGQVLETTRVRDVQEIINYRDSINFIDKYQGKLTEDFLLDIHKVVGKKILPEKYIGYFRKKNAVVLNTQSGEVVFDPVPAKDIASELEDIFSWDETLNKDEIHPLLRAAILHYEIVRIHPFVDLNGRSARLVATWSLYRDGYDIKKFFSLEEHYDQDLKSYYDALDTANSGDLTQWLEYFTQGVAEELQRIKVKVLALSKDHRLKLKIGQVALNERQLLIIAKLEENEVISNPDFNEMFNDVSEDTILRDLKDLMDKGIIIKKGKTKGARYFLK